MQIIVQGHGLEITPYLRDYVHKKIAKIEQYFSNIQKAEVILDVRSIDERTRRQVAEVNMWLAGKKVIRASEAAGDMYAAIDLVLKEVERQTKKHKDKHVKEKRREAERLKKSLGAPAPGIEKPSRAIVKVSRFSTKPMSPEEAKEELKLSKDDFIIFRNAETHSPNLVYRSGAKTLELIEPEKTDIKSLTPEGAAEELGKEGKDFLVFENSNTGGINVIFRRKTGNFGLIEPEY